jgi:hypothetical protein
MAKPDKFEIGCTSLLAIFPLFVLIYGGYKLFEKRPPMTKEERIESRHLLEQQARKSALECEKFMDEARKFDPGWVGKEYLKARRHCWAEWRSIRNAPDD